MDGGEAAATPRMMGSCTGGSYNNKPIVNPIMMRFRPIAPKPLPGGSIPSSVDSKNNNNNSSISKGRTKRKYVRVRRYNRKKKSSTRNNCNNNSTTADDGEFMDDHHQTAMTTLQLLPVIGGGGGGGGGGSENKTETGRMMMMMEKEMRLVSEDPKRGVVGVELWVTVECVTEACMDLGLREGEIGCTDEEKIKNLEMDTCPGFVSDGLNRVEWLNKAFKRMVWQRQRNNNDNKKKKEGGECESPTEVSVWLVSKPKLPNMRRVFTCQIKLQFKIGMEMEKDSKVVPCDAWRMDGGGFAWKLDVKAALTLAPLLQEDFD